MRGAKESVGEWEGRYSEEIQHTYELTSPPVSIGKQRDNNSVGKKRIGGDVGVALWKEFP